MLYSLDQISCLSKEQVAILNAAGFKTNEDFLADCCKVTHRRRLAAKTGIDEGFLLNLTNLCDLLRVDGVTEPLVALFRAEKIKTIRALRNRVPEHLQPTLVEVNNAQHIVPQVPSLAEIQKIVASAKCTKPCLTY